MSHLAVVKLGRQDIDRELHFVLVHVAHERASHTARNKTFTFIRAACRGESGKAGIN